MPNPFTATRYHSLVVERDSLPDCLEITAWTEDANGAFDEIMGLRHQNLSIEGVQFHPESILTRVGHDLLRNFLNAPVRAAAETRWIPLPSHADAVDVVVLDARGGLRASIQVAPPHAVVPGQPELQEALVSAPLPLPLAGPVSVPAGAFIRVLFEAEVGGPVLPSAAGFSILER